MSRSHEPQREREVQRYLQSWQVARGSSLNVALNVESIAAPNLRETGYKPQASADKALTAFAQLAVFRLSVKRAMVSLIDASTQIILAEATRTLRLADLLDGATNGGTNADSDLWLGATVLSRPDAICEHCFTNKINVCEANGNTYSATGLVVPDCSLDARFQTRTYVQSEPGVRFYAGVPIISRNGHLIGAYAVSDDKPRHGLTIDEIQFMQSVSQAVMEHLEWARDRVDRFKGERIVRGLAAFIEGSSTLSDDQAVSKDELSRPSSAVRPPEMTVSSRRGTITRANSYFRELESKVAGGFNLATPSRGSRPSSRSPPHISSPEQSKSDGLSRMFHRASEILLHSTLADGVVLFGASGANARPTTRGMESSGRLSSDDDDLSLPVTSGSEGVGVDSSDSDTSPTRRPCKILAYSLADKQARADIEQDTALCLGTLEKYYSLFPKGKTFSFTEDGAGISSEDDSASDREPVGFTGSVEDATHNSSRHRKPKMDHRELLKKIPGAKSVVFVPLFDYSEDKLAGGCFLWTSVTGRMMNLDEDLSYLRAFVSSIMSEVGRINTQKNEAAKTTFIASMSHELRSPLHGILGAAEFLRDTGTDSYQSGLISSIATCGKTLLETLNHVLDYSKINRLGRLHMKRGRQNKLINLSSDSFESLNMTAVVDLGVLVEEVVDAIAAGHTFRKLPGTGYPGASGTSIGGQAGVLRTEGSVSVLLDISPRASWMVRTQPGALRRIIMNLFGNSLKYTSSGFILVSLRAQESSDGSKVDALIRVVDTGKGMSEEFQRSRLFIPFSQEDSFQPGTGLGLSIVKQIVDSLGGTLEVKSQQGKGTEVDVRLRLTPARGQAPPQHDETMSVVSKQTKGLKAVLLDGQSRHGTSGTLQFRKLSEILVETCSDWLNMEVTKSDANNASDAAVYISSETPSIQTMRNHFQGNNRSRSDNRKRPLIIVCLNAEEAVRISQTETKVLAEFSDIIEVIPQPCGPRKLAKVIGSCLKQAENLAKNQDATKIQMSTKAEASTEAANILHRRPESQRVDKLIGYNPQNTPTPSNGLQALSPPQSPPPLDPDTPSLAGEINVPIQTRRQGHTRNQKLHVLLVDDNKINLQLLVMFMKKCGFSYEEAENGQEAVDRFEEANNPDPQTKAGCRRFDFVLMDISMPVMNGMEATKRIRDIESQHNMQRTTVIALTGLASADAQRDAKLAGVDIFLPKPVRFAELEKLLTHE